MPDWVVDCSGDSDQDVRIKPFYQDCVQNKFKGMQYAVLGLFQGYLAQLPLQQRHFLFLASVQSHSLALLQSVHNMAILQGQTIHAQRTALQSFESSSLRLLTAIDTYIDPIIRYLPTIESANNLTSELQTQLIHFDGIGKTLSAIVLFFIPLALILILLIMGWIMRIRLFYLALAFGAIWALKKVCFINTSWAIFFTILAYFILQTFFDKPSSSYDRKECKDRFKQEKSALRTRKWGELLGQATEAWLA